MPGTRIAPTKAFVLRDVELILEGLDDYAYVVDPLLGVEVARGDAGGETGLEGLRGVSPHGGRAGGRRDGSGGESARDPARRWPGSGRPR